MNDIGSTSRAGLRDYGYCHIRLGGHRENGESFLACAQREIHEEIGCLIPLERFEPLMRCQAKFSDGSSLEGEYFLAHGVPSDRLTVTEGTALFATLDELPQLLPRMAPSACFITRYFLTSLPDPGATRP